MTNNPQIVAPDADSWLRDYPVTIILIIYTL